METTQETGVLNLRNIPVQLKRRFKRQCVLEDVTMRQKLLDLIKQYTESKSTGGK